MQQKPNSRLKKNDSARINIASREPKMSSGNVSSKPNAAALSSILPVKIGKTLPISKKALRFIKTRCYYSCRI